MSDTFSNRVRAYVFIKENNLDSSLEYEDNIDWFDGVEGAKAPSVLVERLARTFDLVAKEPRKSQIKETIQDLQNKLFYMKD